MDAIIKIQIWWLKTMGLRTIKKVYDRERGDYSTIDVNDEYYKLKDDSDKERGDYTETNLYSNSDYNYLFRLGDVSHD